MMAKTFSKKLPQDHHKRKILGSKMKKVSPFQKQITHTKSYSVTLISECENMILLVPLWVSGRMNLEVKRCDQLPFDACP